MRKRMAVPVILDANGRRVSRRPIRYMGLWHWILWKLRLWPPAWPWNRKNP